MTPWAPPDDLDVALGEVSSQLLTRLKHAQQAVRALDAIVALRGKPRG